MENPITWVTDQAKKLKDDIWQSPFKELSKKKSFLFRQLRIIYLAASGFTKNIIQLRASALTFYSLLSIIPIVAIAFAIAKGFGLDQNLEELIIKEFESHQEILNWLLTNARNALQETRGGYIAGVGVIILFYSVMALLEHIEISFNSIWQIRTERPWYRKFTDYLTIMLIAPVFIVLSSSVTVFISTELTDFMSRAPILDFFKPIITFLFKFTPYFLSWIILTLLFIIMPNTKVKFMPAMISGIIAGTILVALQWLYIDLQFGISKLSAIYGSFAAIPLFIIWMQSSWIIVLIGAQLTYFNQNISKYELEAEKLNISNYQTKALVLMILNLIIRHFAVGEKPLSIRDISINLGIPNQIVNNIIQDLKDANLISIVQEDENSEELFQPALDINKITVGFVFLRLDKKGVENKVVVKNKDYEKIMVMLNKFDELISKSDSNILIKDL
jgi:membrane protein